MPALKKKYLKYENYKEQKIEDIFTSEQLQGAVKWEVNELKSMVLLNDGKGNFTFQALPIEAQFAPLKALFAEDIDGDGYVDLIAGGNFMEAKPETGIYAATYGLYLKGNGDGSFEFIPARESGLLINGAIRDFLILKTDSKRKLLVLKNDAAAQVFEIGDKILPWERIEAAGYDWKNTGENIGKGQRDWQTIFDDWVESPGHCKNIMSAPVEEIAVYFIDYNNGQKYWTMLVAAER